MAFDFPKMPDFSQLDELGKNLVEFMSFVKTELKSIKETQNKILNRMSFIEQFENSIIEDIENE